MVSENALTKPTLEIKGVIASQRPYHPFLTSLDASFSVKHPAMWKTVDFGTETSDNAVFLAVTDFTNKPEMMMVRTANPALRGSMGVKMTSVLAAVSTATASSTAVKAS